jgi:hypothetical protein
MIMKTTLVTCLSSLVLACSLFAQTPTLSPDVTASASASIAPTAAPAVTAPAPAATPAVATSPSTGEDLESRIERKAKRGVNITFGDDDNRRERKAERRERKRDEFHIDGSDFDEGALMAIPIVGIIFTTLFGAPVLIVGMIMFFSYWKARSLHRTVRMMVEKGQPVPEALFATPASPIRQRSDMRRGVILTMIGFGVMIFFGAMDDWDGGAWAVGIIPFLIGAGYLLVWKLEQNKASTDNASRLS